MFCVAFERLAQFFRFSRGLVDDGAPVDDINKTARELRPVRTRDQPERHHRCLAEAGRNIERRRQISPYEMPGEEALLPP